MTIQIPDLPAADARWREGSGRAQVSPRYEDITQDGRLVLTALMAGLGRSAWRALLDADRDAYQRMRATGILPILRRLVLVGEPGPFSVNATVDYEGHFRFAREKNGDRLFLLMWLEGHAPHYGTFDPDPPADAPRALVGRVFAEHVVTRPFAPPDERKVTRLEIPGLPDVPEREYVYEDAEALVSGAPLEDGGDVLFGMMHTDSNQHVNSLVYPRIAEEAAVRRAKRPDLLARAVEMRWRKPFFAGDTARLRLRLDGTSAAGALYDPARPDKPSSAFALRLG